MRHTASWSRAAYAVDGIRRFSRPISETSVSDAAVLAWQSSLPWPAHLIIGAEDANFSILKFIDLSRIA